MVIGLSDSSVDEWDVDMRDTPHASKSDKQG